VKIEVDASYNEIVTEGTYERTTENDKMNLLVRLAG
jgi:hypothetical protein